MKAVSLHKIPHIFLVMFIAVAATIASSPPGVIAAESTTIGKFRAASAKVDITPDRPQWLRGYGKRLSEGVHDKIYHRIVAMDDGTTQFFLVSTDVVAITPSFYDDFCKKLESETAIQRDQIWWSATHTHAAPQLGPPGLAQLFTNTLGDRYSIEHDTAYWDRVERDLIDGIKDARSRLEPARLGVGAGIAFANINRRGQNARGESILGVDLEAPVDRQIGLIRLERTDSTPIALIANYAIHGTVIGGHNMEISGDVPGVVAEYVENKLGAPMLFINGAEGNIAPIYSVREGFRNGRLSEFKALLGNRILEANDALRTTSGGVTFSLGRTIIETPRKAGLGWLDELSSYARVSEGGTNLVRIPVVSLTIDNDTVIWAAPLELFCEVALNVRAASPFDNTFYFGLTNGSLLYLPTKKAFAEGGYEPAVSPFTEHAEEDFTSGVIDHIQEVYEE